eukprot:3604720-Lingulodinium_polyedra.AAC.1
MSELLEEGGNETIVAEFAEDAVFDGSAEVAADDEFFDSIAELGVAGCKNEIAGAVVAVVPASVASAPDDDD